MGYVGLGPDTSPPGPELWSRLTTAEWGSRAPSPGSMGPEALAEWGPDWDRARASRGPRLRPPPTTPKPGRDPSAEPDPVAGRGSCNREDQPAKSRLGPDGLTRVPLTGLGASLPVRDPGVTDRGLSWGPQSGSHRVS